VSQAANHALVCLLWRILRGIPSCKFHFSLSVVAHFARGHTGVVDLVPLEPTNICDIGLAALGRFGQKDANVAQKATAFLAQF
jgi:hypothetical protein